MAAGDLSLSVGCACKKFTSYLSFRSPIGYALGDGTPITGAGYTPKMYFLSYRHVHTEMYNYAAGSYYPDEDWTRTWSTETANYGASFQSGSNTLGDFGGNLHAWMRPKITAPGRYIFTGNFTTYVEGGPFQTTDYNLTSYVPSIITTVEVREVVAAYRIFNPPRYGNLTRYFTMQLDDAFMRSILLRDVAFPETCHYSSTLTQWSGYEDTNNGALGTVPKGGVETYDSEYLYSAYPLPPGWPNADWPADGSIKFDQAYYYSRMTEAGIGDTHPKLINGLSGVISAPVARMMKTVLHFPGKHSLQTRLTTANNTGLPLSCQNLDVECPIGGGYTIEPPAENGRRIVWIENQRCAV